MNGSALAGVRTVLAAVLIVTSVILVTTANARRRPRRGAGRTGSEEPARRGRKMAG